MIGSRRWRGVGFGGAALGLLVAALMMSASSAAPGGAGTPSPVRLDEDAIRRALSQAPRDTMGRSAQEGVPLSLPAAGGRRERFSLVETRVMEESLAARYPEIRTYRGIGIDDPTAMALVELTPLGLTALVSTRGEKVEIRPGRKGGRRGHELVPVTGVALPEGQSFCQVADETSPDRGLGAIRAEAGLGIGLAPPAPTEVFPSGGYVFKYRLAIAASSSYTQRVSPPGNPNKPAALAAIAVTVNRLNATYRTDLSLEFELVANEDALIVVNPAGDPFTSTGALGLAVQAHTFITSTIGSGAYDIGHLFHGQNTGGYAALGACAASTKGRASSGSVTPYGNLFDVDLVAHEIGHQLSALHAFNSNLGLCMTRDAASAIEPGSGSTIMGAAGRCTQQGYVTAADPHFNARSILEMQIYMNGNGACKSTAYLGNQDPTIAVGPWFEIPTETSFFLEPNTAVDPEGDPILFSWEERDLGPAQPLGAPDNNQSPLFRVYPPTTQSRRYFPKYSDILADIQSPGEMLPQGGGLTREMNFTLMARDNKTGINSVTTTVRSTYFAGPFRVSAPAEGAVWTGTNTVTWDVAGTTAYPMLATEVDILLSTDGGQTFPILLSANSPNDGSEAVTLPAINAAQARIKIQPISKIFFAISRPFAITDH